MKTEQNQETTVFVPEGGGSLSERISAGIGFANQIKKPVVLEFNDHKLIINPESEIEEMFVKWDEMLKEEQAKLKIRASQDEEGFGTIIIDL